MRRTYRITLRNQDPTLDLRRWKTEIRDVIGFCQDSYADTQGVRIYRESLEIHQHELTMEVEEKAKDWHARLGWLLKNEHGMPQFCDPNNSNRMFNWAEL